MKLWLAAGLLLSLAPFASADEGAIVLRVEGSNITLRQGLQHLMVGQRVQLNVTPMRKFGGGRATVTDVDPYQHLLGLVMEEKVKNDPTKLFQNDLVFVTTLGGIVDTPPDFKVARMGPPPEVLHTDLALPSEAFTSPVQGQGAAPGGSPAAPVTGTGTNGRPAVNIPDLENLLRSLPSTLPSGSPPVKAPTPSGAVPGGVSDKGTGNRHLASERVKVARLENTKLRSR